MCIRNPGLNGGSKRQILVSVDNLRPAALARLRSSISGNPVSTGIDLTKHGEVGVIPFPHGQYKIQSTQQIKITKAYVFKKREAIEIIGYASSTSGQDDVRVSLDRALEAKKALLKLHPDLSVSVLGGGVTKNPLCAGDSNQCAVIEVLH